MGQAVEVERGEVVIDGFGATNRDNVAVFAKQQLGGTEFAVVVEPHGMAVGTGVVNDNEVAGFDDSWERMNQVMAALEEVA